MSITLDCSACSLGNHDRHNRDEGVRPGLIGGTVCGCTGDCAERFQHGADRFRQMVSVACADPYNGPTAATLFINRQGMEIRDRNDRVVYLSRADARRIAEGILEMP